MFKLSSFNIWKEISLLNVQILFDPTSPTSLEMPKFLQTFTTFGKGFLFHHSKKIGVKTQLSI